MAELICDPKCTLYKTCTTVCMHAECTSDKSRLMIIGEAPGATEDAEGTPFVGRSGKLLREIVSESGVKHFGVVYTNAVRCRPPDNKTPTTRQIAYCKPYLLSDIDMYKPDVVMLLGNTPLKSMLGESGITNWRGVKIEKDGITYVPTYHPAYVLRNQSIIGDMLDDFDLVYNILDGKDTSGSASDGYEIVDVCDVDTALTMLETIKAAPMCSWDTELTGLNPFSGDVMIMMSFAVQNPEKIAWAVRMDDDILDICDTILASPDVKKVGHNVKFDMNAAYKCLGNVVEGVAGDSMLASYVLDPVPGRHGLKVLAGRHLGMYDYDIGISEYTNEHPEANPSNGGDFGLVPADILVEYSALDAIATIELERMLVDRMEDKQRILYEQLLIVASNTLSRMESNGAMIDKHIVDRYVRVYSTVRAEQMRLILADPCVRKYVTDRGSKEFYMSSVRKSLRSKGLPSDIDNVNKIARRKAKNYKSFNPGSSQQMSAVLYDKRYYGLKCVGFTEKGNKSVKWEYIKGYVDSCVLLPTYRYYTLLSSMLSTYLRPARDNWVDDDGRVRSNYRVVGSRTGRLSSSDPNLQNIPTPEKEPGTLLETLPIKNIFTHTWDGGCILAVDYSGMELRVMASVSECAGMIDALNDGEDLHSYVTELLHNVKRSDYTSEEWKSIRYRGKWVNWTLLFGGSYWTLMSTYNIEEQEAKRLVATYYSQFPEILEYKEYTIAYTREHGYVESPFGRRRYMPYINDSKPARRHAAERAAINMPIQSAASDLLLCALIMVQEKIDELGLKSLIVNTVHDSLVFDVYPGELEILVGICKDMMEGLVVAAQSRFPDLDFSWIQVPLVVDMEVGSHYGSTSVYKE